MTAVLFRLLLPPAHTGGAASLRLEPREVPHTPAGGHQPLGEALDIAMEPVATYSGDPTILTLVNWGTGLILIGRDGRSESTVNRISRFVFALPSRERLEAKSSPQMAPTFSERPGGQINPEQDKDGARAWAEQSVFGAKRYVGRADRKRASSFSESTLLPLKRGPTTWPSASHTRCGANDQDQRCGQPQ